MADNVVVLDFGTATIKAGMAYNFPSEEEPRVVTPAAVKVMEESAAGAVSAAASNEELATLPGHIVTTGVRGTISNWDGFESILHHILYNQFGWEVGDEGSLLIAEPLYTSKADRERLTQLMFEEFNVSGLFLCDQAVLSLYAIGKLTGCVIDFGHGKTDIASVSEGQLHVAGARRLEFGGIDLTQHLADLLKQRGITVDDPASLQWLKEQCIRVAENAALAAETPAEPKTYTLPNGQAVTITNEGTLLGEAMLRPPIKDMDCPSVPDAIFMACTSHVDPGLRKACLETMLVCGGGSGVPGLLPRLHKEMTALCPPSLQPQFCTCPGYMPEHTFKYSVWMGGAILSKVIFQQNQHITKYEYDEMGPTVVHKKCA
ncbi:hypothetical protein WJX72_006966 [[Myrmecia] bisecta]|uniref:Uncharacterized protein n=1 Tax=[Myrmecia] bisecta TaxID=41462 RepID=A0AAW1QFH3_9CHLO